MEEIVEKANDKNANNILYEFMKNSAEKVVFMVSSFNGHDIINIRVMRKNETEDYRFTKKGIALSVKHIDELLKGLEILKGAIGSINNQ